MKFLIIAVQFVYEGFHDGVARRHGVVGGLSLSLQSTMRIIADEVNRGYIGSE